MLLKSLRRKRHVRAEGRWLPLSLPFRSHRYSVELFVVVAPPPTTLSPSAKPLIRADGVCMCLRLHAAWMCSTCIPFVSGWTGTTVSIVSI